MPARLRSDDIASLREKGQVVLFKDGQGPKRPNEAVEKNFGEMLHAVKEVVQRESELGDKIGTVTTAIKDMAKSLESTLKDAMTPAQPVQEGIGEEEFLEIEVNLRLIQAQLDQIIELQKASAKKRKYKFVHTRQYNQIVTEVTEV